MYSYNAKISGKYIYIVDGAIFDEIVLSGETGDILWALQKLSVLETIHKKQHDPKYKPER